MVKGDAWGREGQVTIGRGRGGGWKNQKCHKTFKESDFNITFEESASSVALRGTFWKRCVVHGEEWVW